MPPVVRPATVEVRALASRAPEHSTPFEGGCDECCRTSGHLRCSRAIRQLRRPEAALRELHRRPLGATGAGRVRRERDARDGRAVHRGSPLEPRGRRARTRRGPRRQGSLGRDLDHRAVAHPQQDRGRDRGAPRAAGRRRELGQRQAGAGNACGRYPAGRGSLPLLRLGHPWRGGRDLRDRQEHDRVPLPRAARRRRADHPVQLPAADGGVEAGAGAGGGQRRRAEAGEPDPVVDPQADGAARGDRARGRDQRRQRAGCGDREGARDEQAHLEDRLHRRDGHRTADHAVRGARTSSRRRPSSAASRRTSSSPT